MSAPVDPLLGITEVERATSLERTTIWRRCRAGAFPAPGYVANRRVWRASVIEAWVREELERSPARRGAANLKGAAAVQAADVLS